MQSTRRSVLLRFHFWGALIASPFAISAAPTGLFYVLAPTLDTWKHADLGRVQVTRMSQLNMSYYQRFDSLPQGEGPAEPVIFGCLSNICGGRVLRTAMHSANLAGDDGIRGRVSRCL